MLKQFLTRRKQITAKCDVLGQLLEAQQEQEMRARYEILKRQIEVAMSHSVETTVDQILNRPFPPDDEPPLSPVGAAI